MALPRWLRTLLFSAVSLKSAIAGPPETDAEKRARIDALYADYQRAFSEVPEVDPAEAKARVERGEAVLVDVREPEERAVSMLPNAVDEATWKARRAEWSDKQVITYCTIGARSGSKAAQWRDEGVDAVNLKGSVLAWSHAGYDFVTPEGEPTKRVHVYGRTWNLLADGYEPVW